MGPKSRKGRTAQRKAEDDEKRLCEMRREIADVPRTNTFHLIHANSLCKTSDGDVLPCEVAVVEFSVVDGVSRVFHAFVAPKQIPLGYAYEIRLKAERSHGLEPDSETSPLKCEAAKDYKLIAETLFDILGGADVIYATKENAEDASGVVANILNWAKRSEKKIRVFHVEELLRHLTTSATNLIRDEAFLYGYSEFACNYHEDIDKVAHCSMYLAQEAAFKACRRLGLPHPQRQKPLHLIIDNEAVWSTKPVQYDQEDEDSPRKTKAIPAGYTLPLPKGLQPKWVNQRDGSESDTLPSRHQVLQ